MSILYDLSHLKKVCITSSLIPIAKVYNGKIKPNATPTAASTIMITPIIAKTIPKILAIFVATGGNIPAIAYNMIPIIKTTIPPTKLISSYCTKKVINI